MQMPKIEIPKQYMLPAAAAVILVACGSAVFFYRGYAEAKQQVRDLKQNPQIIAQETAKDLVARVSELIVLPTDETPTVATVSDLEKLKGQQFFANAKVGDKVLIYTKAKKAVLYDPDAHKIVEVAPLNLGNADAADMKTAR